MLKLLLNNITNLFVVKYRNVSFNIGIETVETSSHVIVKVVTSKRKKKGKLYALSLISN
jgi:hypothetical protein